MFHNFCPDKESDHDMTSDTIIIWLHQMQVTTTVTFKIINHDNKDIVFILIYILLVVMVITNKKGGGHYANAITVDFVSWKSNSLW
jgi:hypothetical protein